MGLASSGIMGLANHGAGKSWGRQIMARQIMGKANRDRPALQPQIMGRCKKSRSPPHRCFASLCTGVSLQAARGNRRGLVRALLGSILRSSVAHSVEREV